MAFLAETLSVVSTLPSALLLWYGYLIEIRHSRYPLVLPSYCKIGHIPCYQTLSLFDIFGCDLTWNSSSLSEKTCQSRLTLITLEISQWSQLKMGKQFSFTFFLVAPSPAVRLSSGSSRDICIIRIDWSRIRIFSFSCPCLRLTVSIIQQQIPGT